MPGTDIMTHSALILRPDPARTVIRPFDLEDPAPFIVKDHSRAQRIVDRILSLEEDELGSPRSVSATAMSRTCCCTASPRSRG